MAEIERIRRNIKKMLDQSAPEKDIDAYIKSEGVTVGQVRSGGAETASAPVGIPQPITPQLTSPPKASPLAKRIDDTIRAAADVLTFGGADELAAGAGSLISPSGGNYSERLKAERERDINIPLSSRIPGMLLGAGLMGGAGIPALAGRGASTAAKTAAGIGAGAATGGAYGFGAGEGREDRLRGAATGAGLGAGVGGVIGGAAGMAAKRAARKAIPVTNKLREMAQKAYTKAEQQGIIIKKDSFKKAVDGIEKKMGELGAHPKLQGRLIVALDELRAAANGNVTLKGADILRRIIKNAGASTDESERWLAGRMLEKFDEYIGALGPADVMAGNVSKAASSLKKARGLWSRFRKAEKVEDMIERARISAPNFSASGFENALRIEFRSLAKNARKMRGFTKAEQASIKKVAKGGKVDNLLRNIGRLAPRGVVSGGFHLGVGAVGGTPIAAGTMLVGESARRAATMATARNARKAAELARAGGAVPLPSLTPTAQQLLRSGIAAGATIPQRGLDEVPAWLRRLLSGERGLMGR